MKGEEEENPYGIKKEERQELQNSQKKYDLLVGKRDDLNREANKIRAERDNLNQEKADVIKLLNDTKAKRDLLRDEIEKHKKLRDTYQKNAKNLVAAKKNKKDGKVDLDSDIHLLNSEIIRLEQHYETTPVPLDEEKKLLDTIREKRQKFEKLKKEVPIQIKISDDIKTLDERIDELFKLADDEHKEFVKFVEDSKAFKNKLDEFYQRIKHLASEGDKKHQEFLEARERANKVNEQILEMREKLMNIRKDHRERRDVVDDQVRDQNRLVKETFDNDKVQKESEDKALEALLKKGKLTM